MDRAPGQEFSAVPASDCPDRVDAKGDTIALNLLSAIVDSSHDAIISKDLRGVILSWNPAAEQLFGYTAEEAIGRHIDMLIPPDRLSEEPEILGKIQRGERVDHFETIRRRKDGSLIDISLTISPVRNSAGEIVAASKIARDVSPRRQAEEQQKLIAREMSHRIKNLFTITSAIVTMSARTAATPAEMAQSLRGRLNALTRAHELTRPGIIEDVAVPASETSLRQMLDAIFLPYQNDDPDRGGIVLDGPEIRIGGGAIASFALIFHEFATNAAKYGGLCEGGRVTVSWQTLGTQLHIRWIEDGGPTIASEPERKGFGATLAARVIEGQFGGTLSYHWRREGLEILISIEQNQLGSATG